MENLIRELIYNTNVLDEDISYVLITSKTTVNGFLITPSDLDKVQDKLDECKLSNENLTIKLVDSEGYFLSINEYHKDSHEIVNPSNSCGADNLEELSTNMNEDYGSGYYYGCDS